MKLFYIQSASLYPIPGVYSGLPLGKDYARISAKKYLYHINNNFTMNPRFQEKQLLFRDQIVYPNSV